MVRRVLSDSIWEQLQVTMKTKGCHRCKNDREIMEAILWKLRTGAPWRDLPITFCHGKQRIIVLIVGQRKACGRNFF